MSRLNSLPAPLKPPGGGWRAVTFDLWNTLLVSVPGAVEVRSRHWRAVIGERGLDVDDDLLHGTLSMLPVRFDEEWRAGRLYGPEQALAECFAAEEYADQFPLPRVYRHGGWQPVRDIRLTREVGEDAFALEFLTLERGFDIDAVNRVILWQRNPQTVE